MSIIISNQLHLIDCFIFHNSVGRIFDALFAEYLKEERRFLIMNKYGVIESYFGKFFDKSLLCVADSEKNAKMICSAFADYRNKQGRDTCYQYSAKVVSENPSYCRYAINDIESNFVCAVDDVNGAKQICSALGKGYSYIKITDDFIDFLDDENFFDNFFKKEEIRK